MIRVVNVFAPRWRGRLLAGAHNTIQSGLPLTRESGFFISAWRAKPGSVLAIQDPYGESGRPDFGQVVKCPAFARFHASFLWLDSFFRFGVFGGGFDASC